MNNRKLKYLCKTKRIVYTFQSTLTVQIWKEMVDKVYQNFENGPHFTLLLKSFQINNLGIWLQ